MMSQKERKRKVVFEEVLKGRLTLIAAKEQLGISYRQVRRVFKRYKALGDHGLVHRSRGRPSTRSKPEGFKKSVLAAFECTYQGFGATLASEKLAEREGLVVHPETLRRWLKAAGLWVRRRKRRPQRSYRERRESFGELLQIDGSHHRWFGPDEPASCLLNIVDDATGISLSRLGEQETSRLLLETFWSWIER